jgi:hypothetical protein
MREDTQVAGDRLPFRDLRLDRLTRVPRSGFPRACLRCERALEAPHRCVGLSREIVQHEEEEPQEELLDETDDRPDERLRREAQLWPEANTRSSAGEVEARRDPIAGRQRRQHLELEAREVVAVPARRSRTRDTLLQLGDEPLDVDDLRRTPLLGHTCSTSPGP